MAKHDPLALEAAKQGPEIKYLLQTSQAVDIISGGVKINALPERAQAIVNHRINGMCNILLDSKVLASGYDTFNFHIPIL